VHEDNVRHSTYGATPQRPVWRDGFEWVWPPAGAAGLVGSLAWWFDGELLLVAHSSGRDNFDAIRIYPRIRSFEVRVVTPVVSLSVVVAPDVRPSLRRNDSARTYRTTEEQRLIAKLHRDANRAEGKCINAPRVGDVGRGGVAHGPPVTGGKCQHCRDVSRGRPPQTATA
jgi:hypothetical protein